MSGVRLNLVPGVDRCVGRAILGTGLEHAARHHSAAPGESPEHTHERLNARIRARSFRGTWKRTPLPSSSPHAGEGRITFDAAIAAAQREGIGQRFCVGVPSGVDGIWTIAQTGLNRDITDPLQKD